MNSLLLSFCVNDAQLIAGSTGDVKGDWGASPTSTRRRLSGHRHCSHSLLGNIEIRKIKKYENMLQNSEMSKNPIEKATNIWYNPPCRAVALSE